jgi:hypothetical protein
MPSVSAEFGSHMDDILDRYATPYASPYPLVCFDESPYPLVHEVHQPLRGSQCGTTTNIAGTVLVTCACALRRCRAGGMSRSLTDVRPRTVRTV